MDSLGCECNSLNNYHFSWINTNQSLPSTVVGVGVVVVVAKMSWNIIGNNNFQTSSTENHDDDWLDDMMTWWHDDMMNDMMTWWHDVMMPW